MLSRLMTVREQVILLAFAASVVTGAVVLYMQRDASARGEEAVPAAVLLPAPAPEASEATSLLSDLQQELPETVEAVAPPEPPEVMVAIQGAVRVPGAYRMPGGSRVQDLLVRAGGATLQADISNINTTALLLDGTTLTIPAQPARVQEENTFSLRRASPVYNLPHYTRFGNPLPHPAPPGVAAAAAGTPGSGAAPPAASATGTGLINLNTASAEELATLPGIGPELSRRIISHRTHSPFRTVEDLRQVAGIGDKRMETMRPLVTVQ